MPRKLSLFDYGIMPVLAFIGMGLYSLSLGQDYNWDLLNYHFYNPFAFLNDRMGFDYAPAMLQTYHNPIIDLPFYFLVTHFPPKWVGFVMGGIHGMNFWLVFLIARIFLFKEAKISNILLSGCVAFAGMFGAGGRTLVGTTFNDNLVSLFMLTTIWILLKEVVRSDKGFSRHSLLSFASAGLILGFGCGLKLTLLIYVFWTMIAILTLYQTLSPKIKSCIILSLGFTTGFLMSSGFWMLELWQRFGNPWFPRFNNIFKSPYSHFDFFMIKNLSHIPPDSKR